MAARYEREDAVKKASSNMFLFCKERTIGAARGAMFLEMRPGAGFKTPAISLKKSWWGYSTVERLLGRKKNGEALPCSAYQQQLTVSYYIPGRQYYDIIAGSRFVVAIRARGAGSLYHGARQMSERHSSLIDGTK